MTIYTRRNAAVGYVTLKALSRAVKQQRRTKRRTGLKLGLYVVLGVVSLGILAGAAAVLLRRKSLSGEELDADAGAEAESDDGESAIVGEFTTTAPEPIPAT